MTLLRWVPSLDHIETSKFENLVKYKYLTLLKKFWSIANEEACEANQLIEEAKKIVKLC